MLIIFLNRYFLKVFIWEWHTRIRCQHGVTCWQVTKEPENTSLSWRAGYPSHTLETEQKVEKKVYNQVSWAIYVHVVCVHTRAEAVCRRKEAGKQLGGVVLCGTIWPLQVAFGWRAPRSKGAQATGAAAPVALVSLWHFCGTRGTSQFAGNNPKSVEPQWRCMGSCSLRCRPVSHPVCHLQRSVGSRGRRFTHFTLNGLFSSN